MNSFKYILVAVLSFGIGLSALAQDVNDALRYSYLAPQGTARSMGIGNAGGSVGGDFTSLSINPAGIGVYRAGEMMFTPSLKVNSVSGTYQGNTLSDDKIRFTVNNAGIVFTRAAKGRRYEHSKWKASSFAFGFNRLADFNRNYIYSGRDNASSGSEVFVLDANNNINDLNRVRDYQSPASLGYQAFLINYDTNMGLYRTVVPWDSNLNQRARVHESGSLNEMVFSFGGNYMEKLMLGATVGVPFIRYDRTSDYSEAIDVPTPLFSNYTYTERLTTKGTGINLKLGFIYKPSDHFRVGAAIHSPSYFAMSDVYQNSITANAQGQYTNVSNDPGSIDYTLTTPWKGVLSATGFLGKYGFITADYEYVNYRSMRYRFQSDFIDYETAVNQLIKSTYQAASNFRIGIEGRPVDFMMVRLGFGYYGTPYKTSPANANHMDLSAGVGFRFNHWFTDLGFVHTMYNGQEQPYVLPYVVVPAATLKNSLNNAALTIGFKF